MKTFTTDLILLAGFASLGRAAWQLEDDYTASRFFDMFSFFTDKDPTNGFVDYVDHNTAQQSQLISTNDQNQVYIGVDHTNSISPDSAGRQSVRLTSTAQYNHGLVILDLAHMPGGICGTWPAFWMVGPNWPKSGEIDIIEGVNDQSMNDMTLHTADGCSITNTNDFSGTLGTSNCFVNAQDQSANAGCQIAANDQATYGHGFNANGGGVYAMEWTSKNINIYFFERGSIPNDIQSGNPSPMGWGNPSAQFKGGCDIDEHFQDLNIVFDTTFCGDWAGNTFSSSSTCSALSNSCNSYVASNPSAFAGAYWLINSLKVYQYTDNPIEFSSRPAPTPTGSVVITGLPFTQTSIVGPGATTTDPAFTLNLHGNAGETYSSPGSAAKPTANPELAPAAAYPLTNSAATNAVTAGSPEPTAPAAQAEGDSGVRTWEPIAGVTKTVVATTVMKVAGPVVVETQIAQAPQEQAQAQAQPSPPPGKKLFKAINSSKQYPPIPSLSPPIPSSQEDPQQQQSESVPATSPNSRRNAVAVEAFDHVVAADVIEMEIDIKKRENETTTTTTTTSYSEAEVEVEAKVKSKSTRTKPRAIRRRRSRAVGEMRVETS